MRKVEINTFFLPAAGGRDHVGVLGGVGATPLGRYWSSEQISGDALRGRHLWFESSVTDPTQNSVHGLKQYAFNIRCVR